MYKQGTIVLTPFPFTDLTGQRVRPALILSTKVSGDDVIVCFISSIIPKKLLDSEIQINIKDKTSDLIGLKCSSIIKVNKIATLDKKVILGEMGLLDVAHMRQVKIILKKYLGI